MTAAVSQQLWTSGGVLVQRAQEPNIPFGESLTSTKEDRSDEFTSEYRSEGFPARDIWFLGTLEQGSAQIPEFLETAVVVAAAAVI